MRNIFNLFSNSKSKRDDEYTHIVNPKPETEVPEVNTKESNRQSNIIIYSALVFLFASNVVFFLLLSGYKAEIRNFPRKLNLLEKVLISYADDSSKFIKDIKRVVLDFQVVNKKIQDSDEIFQLLDRNYKANSADITRINKEINGLLSRFELLQNDLEKHKTGGK